MYKHCNLRSVFQWSLQVAYSTEPSGTIVIKCLVLHDKTMHHVSVACTSKNPKTLLSFEEYVLFSISRENSGLPTHL